MQQTDGFNADILSEQKRKLKELFPEVFSEDKVDFDKLRATLGDDVDLGERYGLSWKGKSQVFAKIQEKTVSTLHPQPEESVDWDTTQNMFIEGDNLEALKVLHKAYYGKVKMIYIDPPYNTGNDFVYNDDFKQRRREHDIEAGITDDEGNITRDDGLRVNAGGHKHSNWLDMIYPRLFLARNLLRQDGVIFVSIDDNEVHNLLGIMNEIFGEENFIAQIIWRKRSSPDARTTIGYVHDYVLCYSRNIENSSRIISKMALSTNRKDAYKNPDNDPRGPWASVDMTGQTGRAPKSQYYNITLPSGRVIGPPKGRAWGVSLNTYNQMVIDGRIWFGVSGDNMPRMKRFLSEADGQTVPSFWDYTDVGSNDEANKETAALFGMPNLFDSPKPVRLIRRMCEITTRDNDVILDFFSGSGTTAQAVNELNAEEGGSRKWIMVQLPELTNLDSEAYQAGYRTIADITRERIRRAGVKISKEIADKIAERKNPLDFGFRSYVLGDSNFKKWNELVSDPEEIKQQTLDSLNPLEDDVSDEDLLTEILLKRGISPLVEIEKHDDFFFIPSENLVISPSRHMTPELFDHILAKSPSQIILLDQIFKDDVNSKTNLILQAEKQNVVVEVL